jgi:tetratricopeptide (TPR) repeat protein
MDPDNEEAAQLLAQVEKAGHRERTIAETRSAVEELIEAGSLEEAAARIDSVIAILGQVEELHPLNERIVKLRDEHRDAAVQALTEKSERLAQQGQHQEAIARLETALGLDPDNPTVQARLADAREALDRQQREQEPPEVDVAAAGELAVPAAPRPVELAAAFPETPVAVAGSSRARVPTSVPWKIVAPAAAAVLALIVVTVLVVRGFGPSEESDVLAGGLSTGTLVINALPWAEVVEIRDAEDNPVELPSDAYTPISLDLPAGSYRISLRDPQGDRPVTFDAQVTAGDTASRTERFSPPDATQFLQKYGL